MNSFYSDNELKKIGFKKYGKNVLISKKCSIYNAELISIGNNVRIDDFCILSGNIELGNYIHISAYNALYGKLGIKVNDYSGISPRCTLFSATDDFSGEYMISPMVPECYTKVTGGTIILGKYTQVGTNSVVMPNIIINEGAVCGAFSFVNSNLDEWTINVGIPAKTIKKRSKNIINLSGEFNDE